MKRFSDLPFARRQPLWRPGVLAEFLVRARQFFAHLLAGQQAHPAEADTRIAEAVQHAAPNEVFTPTRPRAGRRKLVGRQAELARVLEALTDEAAHVVIYAERGRGKTSLANLAVERLRRTGVVVGRHACDAGSDFEQIIRGVLRDLPASLLAGDHADHGAPAGVGCEAILPHGALEPADVGVIPGRLACGRLVFVIDEFDRVLDQATRTRLADTIKLLSDRGIRLLFMIVGVSSTLEQILGQHPSIQRNIAAVHLPLLDDSDIAELLVRGGAAAGVAFSQDACEAVAGVARGMPYMAQLMGLRIAQQSVSRGASATSAEDIKGAIARLLAEAPPEIVELYDSMAVDAESARGLRQIAAAPQDRWGRLKPAADELGLRGRLVAEAVLAPGTGPQGTLQQVNRKFIYHVLLLAARDASRVLPRVPRGSTVAAQ